ncbi:MAG: 3-deoxy-D-manno-octulosonic acid transferase [Bacteroidetes bacterium]|nr:3-deoxy-D-manno-octulosonic acid transferase [Bacteroidota bacterium]MBS1649509.1 3-deoxy-D-manno-octulosonic acid transferase [Bacteroidota bacterium]
MKLFYRFFVFLYPTIAKLISGNNTKAALWVQGRKNILEKIEGVLQNNTHPIIWMHCSSLGEFEQGRPLIEKLKTEHKNQKILLTFFSPSGYEIRKNYEGADWVFYLPMDNPSNARKFISIVKPSLIIFVKYEFWFYYLTEIKKQNIPLLLVSGIFRKEQPFFKWYGSFYRNMLQCFTHLFVQTETSAQLLASIGFTKNITVTGDTRFDRVIEIANNFKPIEIIEQFIGNNKVIVAGSTWTEDDEELKHYANTHPEIKFIVAPHDVQLERINECLQLYKNVMLYSSLMNHESLIDNKNKILTNCNCLIIDNIGMLSKLYKYATICYVGGAFGGDGVHNVLEAAVYNKPVVFGPEYEKYVEAIELIDAEAAFTVDNALDLEKIFNELLNDEKIYNVTKTNAGNYVKSKSGATQKVIEYIYEKRLLTIVSNS